MEGDRDSDGGDATRGAGAKPGEQPSKFDRSLKTTDVFLAIFAGITGAAAIASAGVAIWTACQLGTTTAQTDKAIGELATLADQTKLQADAAGRAAGAQQGQLDELRSEQRPWVGLELIQNSQSVTTGHTFSISVFFKNYGRSPAFNVRGCVASDTPNIKEQTPVGIRKMMEELRKCNNIGASTVLFPGGDYAFDVSRNNAMITDSVARDIDAGNATIAAFGRVDYRDGAGSPHETVFCALYDRSVRLFRACQDQRFTAD